MSKKVLLMILDGWGIAENPEVSAIDQGHTPFMDGVYHDYPHSKLAASGLPVGLPDGQMGNSEVGHMNLGAGRVVYQDLVKISKSFKESTIADIPNFQKALAAAKAGKKVHLMGLLSDGGVHAHIEHLKGLMQLFNGTDFYIHAFLDGRDTDPNGGINYLSDIEDQLAVLDTGQVASVIGRYYAMDRDQRWERVKKAYDLLVKGVGVQSKDLMTDVQALYDKGITDEFMEPLVALNGRGEAMATIEEGDIVLCFNYRTDRGREITEALTQTDFPDQQMKKLDLHYVTMTTYDQTFKGIDVLFEKDNLSNTIGEVLEANKKTQIRIAESEKYPHVTFFFSGGRELEFEGEKRILCPSPKVATYDLKPEMSAYEIRDKIIPELKGKTADYICLNFANPDMVGHTGDFKAAIKACEVVDECASAVAKAALESDYAVIIIADHGNADKLLNEDGSAHTAHTTVLVPCVLMGTDLNEIKDGKLGDIAPTILDLMGIAKPVEMTGVSLLPS